ncbi:hypothetical protein ALC57_05324 [Trachymyrmex cornetzi]|uniref:Chromo domain-containing protein n=1 Tax=Trachymyrmex cornetzi TaxID=471704 RepID=A0A151JB86_9HYME|nr:hypothetical protein ALC57_05324 [Trachymyrmex cornetzi]
MFHRKPVVKNDFGDSTVVILTCVTKNAKVHQKNLKIQNCKHYSKKIHVYRSIGCQSIISSPSNCGKTNVFISLLESPNSVRFENVYVYSKSLQQPKYQYLENLFTSIDEIGYFTFSNNSDVVPPSEALPNSIFIFDDVACDKQDAVREYFSMSRHANVDCFYLCQTYTRIPKHLIRDNANLPILFKIGVVSQLRPAGSKITPKKQSKKFGKGLPRTMTLNDNAIDYVHWDDPNERAVYLDVYLVEKVLRRKGDEVYVKWLGFDAPHNSWIHKNNII